MARHPQRRQIAIDWATHAGHIVSALPLSCGPMSATASRNMQKVLKLRASKIDYESFRAAAEVMGLTVSGWMRATLLERAAELRAKRVIA